MPMRPSLEAMGRILNQCGVGLPPHALGQLWQYHQMLRAANERLNLTRIHQFENMVLKHYVDSLLVLKFVPELPSPLVDMGTGAGLPGIPLAIARPDTEIILADSRRVRTAFLEEVVRALGLTRVRVHTGSVGERFTEPVRGVITRAVLEVGQTLEAVGACLDPGGRVILMKGPGCDAEIQAARAIEQPRFQLELDHAYAIPGTPHQRRLLIYRREREREGDTELRPGEERLIRSAANPWFKRAKKLLTGKGVREERLALASGARVVRETLARHGDKAAAWITEEAGPPPPEDARQCLGWVKLSERLHAELDPFGTRGPLLLVRVPEIGSWRDDEEWPEGCTLFVPFQDPENVGAVVRSAAAFGTRRIVLTQEAAHPFHPKALRAAGPAVFDVAFERGPSLGGLEVAHVPLLALGLSGPAIDQAVWPERFGLVAGLEGLGLPEALKEPHRLLRIPIAPCVKSLNAAAATAIALYEWRRKHPLAP
jgi:16S rRNA (guanine527-N7)-methyltransferase